MPDEKKADPFKPKQPSIPGVQPGEAKPKPEPPPLPEFPEELLPVAAPKRSVPWTAVATIGAILTVGGLLYWSRGSSTQPSHAAPDAATVAPASAADRPVPNRNLPVGPGRIASTDEMKDPWSAKRFLFRDPLSAESLPALVVRLPGGDYWGFSLREPFGTCELEFVTDLQKLQSEYNFRASHPMVGDPCNHTVYDLTKYGGGSSNDDLVRGLIVQGTGIRPPMAIEIRVEGKDILAARME